MDWEIMCKTFLLTSYVSTNTVAPVHSHEDQGPNRNTNFTKKVDAFPIGHEVVFPHSGFWIPFSEAKAKNGF